MDASQEARARRLDAAIALRWESGKALAAAAGFNPSDISRWRSGDRTPGRDKLEILAPFLGRSVEWLIVGDDMGRLERKIDLALEALGVDRERVLSAADQDALDVLELAEQAVSESEQQLGATGTPAQPTRQPRSA